jgi:hypothetical protein
LAVGVNGRSVARWHAVTASTPTLTTTNGVVAAGMRPWDGARSQQQPSGAHRRESDVFTEDFGLIDHAE